MVAKCFECTAPSVWMRTTQFAGDHYYCDFHARSESDFGENDSYACWVNLHEQQMNELVENMDALKKRVDNVLAGAEHVTDKGYELSTHEKQAEFEASRNQDLDMNKRIRELARQAGVLIDWGEDIKVGRWSIGGNYKNMQKFAELIVRECIDQCFNDEDAERIARHFGIDISEEE
jgi:hypothetical protein